tara:strand:+ start:14965 stop:15444 length:480 start_codon:yes stop_codon:yes gene_type:complete
MTVDFLAKLETEIRSLEHELLHELPKEIQKAREHGDLSENAEYTAAKERQDFVSARLRQLKKRLSELSLIDVTKISADSVGLGSVVRIYDVDNDQEIEYRLVTSEETDVPNGKISTTSPIGRGLMGKQVGDVAEVRTPAGPREFEILELATIHDQSENR